MGTASDRDFYQPCLQCAGSHRSGRHFPVAESVASHALRMHSDHSPLSHWRMLIIAVGGIFCSRLRDIPLPEDRKRAITLSFRSISSFLCLH